LPFRDPSYWPSDFDVTVLDTLKGIQKAVTLGWLNFATFNYPQYEFYEAVQNGDLTVVVPGKFIAFAGRIMSSCPRSGLCHVPC
jgi:cell division cycle 14